MKGLNWSIGAGKLLAFPVVGLFVLLGMNVVGRDAPRSFDEAGGPAGWWLLGAACGLYAVYLLAFLHVGRRIKSSAMVVASILAILTIPFYIVVQMPLFVAFGALGVAQVMAFKELGVEAVLAGWLRIASGMFGAVFGLPMLALPFVLIFALEMRALRMFLKQHGPKRIRVKRRPEVEIIRDKVA